MALSTFAGQVPNGVSNGLRAPCSRTSTTSACVQNPPAGACDRHDELSFHDCTSVDGLPADSLLWVEGAASPQEVQNVDCGQRVLCLDRISGNMKHTAVLGVKKSSGPAEWVDVVLADGTSLTVTSDHPFPQASHGRRNTALGNLVGPPAQVRAKDLKVGEDQVLVLKVMAVTVQSVRLHSKAAPRISVAVHQPARHAIFVSPPGQKGSVNALAVGSVDTSCDSLQDAYLTSTNTFLNILPNPELETTCARCNSCPPDVRAAANEVSDAMEMPKEELLSSDLLVESSSEPESSASDSDSMEGEIILRTAVAPISPKVARSGHDNDFGDWEYRSMREEDECASSDSIALSELLHLWSSGCASLGSYGHAQGECRPCVHENKYHHAVGQKPCKFGALCSYCHELHNISDRVKRKARLMSRKKEPKSRHTHTQKEMLEKQQKLQQLQYPR